MGIYQVSLGKKEDREAWAEGILHGVGESRIMWQFSFLSSMYFAHLP